MNWSIASNSVNKMKNMNLMMEKQQVINYCLSFENVYEDYPFSDQNWCVIRHDENDKVFAWIFEKDNHVWVNVKCDAEWILFWRNAFESVIPSYHLNKEHWNSIILDGTIPAGDIQIMIGNSYDLTLKRAGHRKGRIEERYPQNLLNAVAVNEFSEENINYQQLSEDQLNGLNYILTQLKPREKKILGLRFEEKKTYLEIAELYGRSRSRIEQIIKKALCKLRHPSRIAFVVEGYKAQKVKLDNQIELLVKRHKGDLEKCMQEILEQPIEKLLLSVRSFNALHRSGIRTIGDLKEKMMKPEEDWRCRNLGKMSRREIITKMLEQKIIDKIELKWSLD